MMGKPDQQRLGDSKQEQPLKSSQPAPLGTSTGAGTPVGERAPSTENDNA